MRRERIFPAALVFVATLAAVLVLAVTFVATAAAVENPNDVGYFRTRVSPHVAGVFIEGKYYGTAAMFGRQEDAIKLAPGVYDVKLIDPRYKPLNARVTVEAGKTSTLRRSMEPLEYEVKGPLGELRTDDFGNAAVYLDGKYYANAKELQFMGRTLLLRPGKYHLKIAPADGTIGREEDIEIHADATLIVGRHKMDTYEQ